MLLATEAPDEQLKAIAPGRAGDLAVALRNYWRTRDCLVDVSFYSQQQWRARGEDMCDDAIFSITFEGALYSAINYDSPSIYQHTWDLCRRHGYWFELGYAWSMHIYRLA